MREIDLGAKKSVRKKVAMKNRTEPKKEEKPIYFSKGRPLLDKRGVRNRRTITLRDDEWNWLVKKATAKELSASMMISTLIAQAKRRDKAARAAKKTKQEAQND